MGKKMNLVGMNEALGNFIKYLTCIRVVIATGCALQRF
jgi:hypothetical protein